MTQNRWLNISLKFKGEVGAGETDLNVISAWIVLKPWGYVRSSTEFVERGKKRWGLSSEHVQRLQFGKEMERQKPRERNCSRRGAVSFANCCWLE